MVLVLVPMSLEIIFVALLSTQLLLAERNYEHIQHSKDALLSMSRWIRKAVLTVSSLSTIHEVPTAEEVARMDDLIRQFSAKGFAGSPAIEYPELKDLEAAGEANRQHTLVWLNRAKEEFLKPVSMKKKGKFLQVGPILDLVMETIPLDKQISEIELKLHTQQPEEMARASTLIGATIFIGIVVSFLLSLGLSHLFTKDIIERLRVIGLNAHLLASGKNLLPVLQGNDEICRLDRALHESALVLNEARRKELAILDNAVDVICSIDSKLKFVAAGAAVSKVWHYEQDELIGMSLLTILTDESLEETKRELQRIAGGTHENGHSSHEGTIKNTVKCHDGSLKESLWRISWSPADKRYICVVHDITEMEMVERLKERFLAIVNHDLRSPLTSLGFSFNFLLEGQRGPLPEAADTELRKMNANLKRLMDLVGDFLDLEKFDSGKLVLEMDPVNLRDVAAIAKESLAPLAALKKIEILTPSKDAFCLGEQRRLVQVLINLLSNAIKFSPEGEVVQIATTCNDNGEAELRVIDGGPGIPADELDRVFDKFHQVRSTSTSFVKGTGLGLAIVRAIVEAHGGRVSVVNNETAGSTFCVTLPKYELLDDEEEA